MVSGNMGLMLWRPMGGMHVWPGREEGVVTGVMPCTPRVPWLLGCVGIPVRACAWLVTGASRMVVGHTIQAPLGINIGSSPTQQSFDPCSPLPHELFGLQESNYQGHSLFIPETWVTVEPRADAFVISIGDTFQALCNHRYKSAKHRAVIHATRARHSLVFFINPGLDMVIRPIPELVVKSKEDEEQDRKRPCVEFTWGQLLEFTQKHYRTDVHTLDAFESYLRKTSQAA
ncbi:gibberellin 20 oxidase 1-A-like [Selaginella moellendorffii]|uniref:gibberellin 20 oxidase 1-A-like n=1 Tax=Selaginella moellendorffii TaxID=88036 RepID=UPI000D1C5F0B|nr:gibberellin 20 oxidase 1-A-like [Selaginella moellendorffii]|eukprot:XP_024542626.1 gibberellin 20 oxidase 1-A-like [Selaginella moellendorffii]